MDYVRRFRRFFYCANMFFETNDTNIQQRADEIIKESDVSVEKSADFGQLILPNNYLGMAEPLNKTSDYLRAAIGWAYACVAVIADEVASIDLHLYKRSGKEYTEIEEHPVLNLLYRANAYTTKFDLFWLTQQYLDLTGEAPWFIVRQGNTPVDILLLRPDLIEIKIGGNSETLVDYYEYRVDGGKKIRLEANEVVFLRYPDTTRAFRGRGTVQAAAKTMDIDNFSEDFNRNFFYNSATPASILKTDQKLSADSKKYLEHRIKKLYSGVDNAHKAMILEQGLDWKPMSVSQKDMDFLEQQKFSRDKILGIFRVPRTALGITDDVNRANAEATDYVFAKRTIKPKMQRLVEQLNEFLLPMFPDGENLWLDFTNPVPDDMTAKLALYQVGLTAGFLTINEVRERENLPSIGPAGDVPYQSMGMQPIGTATPPADTITESMKSVMNNHINGRNKGRCALQSEKDLIAGKVAERLTPIVRQMLEKQQADAEQPAEETPPPEISANQKWWETKIFKTNAHEKNFIRKMNGYFELQKRQVLASMGQKASTPDYEKFLIDPKKEAKKMAKGFKPVLVQTIKDGGADGMAQINMSEDLDMERDDVVAYLKDRPFDFSFEVNEETNKKLGATLAEGVGAGEGIPDLRKRVESIFGEMEKYRSERIARSEVIRASNFGTETAYKQSGIVENKVWLTAFDERTCDECMDMDGKTVELGDNFAKTDYENVEHPPLHPSCRCSIIPQVIS